MGILNAGLTNGGIERRRNRRERTDAAVELIWREDSHKRFECGKNCRYISDRSSRSFPAADRRLVVPDFAGARTRHCSPFTGP